MKVFIDTNILISYLLGSGRDSAISSAMRAGLQGVFDIVISREILHELTRSVSAKPYLRSRIADPDVTKLQRLLTSTVELLEPIDAVAFEFSRVSSDNFVVLQAIAADVDFMLTGDQDLLVLGAIGLIRVVNPVEFVAILANAAR